MMKKENNKGITLIALVITIIVMLILVVVTINVSTEGGLIGKAQSAKDQTQREADWEELQLEIAALKADGIELSNLANKLPKDWKVETEADGTLTITSPNGEVFTNIGIEEVEKEYIVEIADKFGNKYKYYRLDKVTEAQREKCREKGIPMLVGDGNLDGKVDEKDLEEIVDIVTAIKASDEYEKVLFDLDIDGGIGSIDLLCVLEICNKLVSLRPFAIQKETEINTDKILVDEETGRLYFIEEKVSEEEAKELEKYGVNRTMLGDLNLDGKLTQEDVDILNSRVSAYNTLNNIQNILGDIDEDGQINISDVNLLSRKLN